jgi:predicted O-methyltransferase YrrM
MSAESVVVTREHFRYIAERTAADDEFLTELKRAAAEAGLPAIWICPEQASFLQILLRASRAREVLEVGTLAGYSAIVMARALPPGGRVRTIEIEPRHADFAAHWIGRSNVSDRIELLRGSAHELLPTLPARDFDAAFLDADKAGYPHYLEECARLLRPGGLVLADNAFAFGQLFDEHPTDPEVPAVRAFNNLMADRTDFHSIIVPFGDGCWVGVRREDS